MSAGVRLPWIPTRDPTQFDPEIRGRVAQDQLNWTSQHRGAPHLGGKRRGIKEYQRIPTSQPFRGFKSPPLSAPPSHSVAAADVVVLLWLSMRTFVFCTYDILSGWGNCESIHLSFFSSLPLFLYCTPHFLVALSVCMHCFFHALYNSLQDGRYGRGQVLGSADAD